MTAVELKETESKKAGESSQTVLREIAATLRRRALSLTPTDVGIDAHTASNSKPNSLWGVVIETAHPDAVASLVVLADGSVSWYVSDGSGCIGCGAHRDVRKSGAELLAIAEQCTAIAMPTDDIHYPERDHVRFYFHTFEGLRSVQVRLEDLNAVGAQLTTLYFAGQRVMSIGERVGAGQSLAQEIRRSLQDSPGHDSTGSVANVSAMEGSPSCLSVGSAARRLRI